MVKGEGNVMNWKKKMMMGTRMRSDLESMRLRAMYSSFDEFGVARVPGADAGGLCSVYMTSVFCVCTSRRGP